jgi:hypothetical protein
MSSQNYDGLDYGCDELSAAMREAYDDIIRFVTTPSFKAVYTELMNCAREDRPAFVMRVLLRPEELAKRGVQVPDGILIQTSAFGDRRPTLFVVKKFLPSKFDAVWQNVNITFDNHFEDNEVTRDPEACWRLPLPVALQNAALAAGIDLESLPHESALKVSSKPASTPAASD